MEDECIGFLGLTYSGKDILVRLLLGDLEAAGHESSFFWEGKRLMDFEVLKKKIYKISALNYRIDNWTVAEYIGLVDEGNLYTRKSAEKLEMEVKYCFRQMGIEFDVSQKMCDLSEKQKRIVDLVKAYKIGAKIVVIEDELEGMSLTDICNFATEMKKMIHGKMSVIVNSHSNEIMSYLSDKYIIFNKGYIVKKCEKSYIKNTTHLEKFLLGESKISEGMTVSKQQIGIREKEIIYQVQNMYFLDKRFYNLSFSRGEVVTLLTLDRTKKEQLFGALSGRRKSEHVSYILNSKYYKNVDMEVFIKERIVSVKDIGTDMEIFPYLSIGDNLLIPSLHKLSSVEFIISAKRIHRMLADSVKLVTNEHNVKGKKLNINELITVTLERWLIYKPQIIVLLEPFALCDMKGVSIIKSYIEQFVRLGVTVIIIKTREEYIEDISDRILRIDE
ncbi:MAG: hypothetical protein PHE02_05445 [Lachnospiraceae bacterium]|nr:hypothetical protein [Lachnospiraceae bacterium]